MKKIERNKVLKKIKQSPNNLTTVLIKLNKEAKNDKIITKAALKKFGGIALKFIGKKFRRNKKIVLSFDTTKIPFYIFKFINNLFKIIGIKIRP